MVIFISCVQHKVLYCVRTHTHFLHKTAKEKEKHVRSNTISTQYCVHTLPEKGQILR